MKKAQPLQSLLATPTPKHHAPADLLVLLHAPLDGGIDDSLQPHGQRVQVDVLVWRVLDDQGLEFRVHLLHGIYGNLHGAEVEFGDGLHLGPPEDAG